MAQKFSKKLNVQLLAETLLAFGIEHIVLSPGSRNGALSTHFTHHPHFKTYSIVDERSAGFVALGMAQQIRKPVVLCCTSGSAAANYYPAVTEAFYQNIPLIVLTADRPEHLVDNFDGQTIRQKNLFELHSYHNTQLSEDESTEILTDNLGLIKKTIKSCMHDFGPVHINMPFSEPLYEFQNTIDIQFDKFEIPEKQNIEFDFNEFSTIWNSVEKKLILVGMQFPDDKLNRLLSELADDDSVVVLTETTSNLYSQRFFNKIDQVIFPLNETDLEKLRPDLLITIGQNVISKKIKSFIRTHKPQFHWHLDEFWQPDTYQCLTNEIKINPVKFIEEFNLKVQKKESNYYKIWNEIRNSHQTKHDEFLQKTAFSDLTVFEELIKTYPENWQIHYGNSSGIRYAQLFDHNSSNEIFCNRGTSGIDGSTSTSIGAAIASQKPTVMVTGDISFFYDSNALWNNYIPKNFRIIIINNGGGNIFKIIPGPENSGVVESVFETRHHLTAENLAKMFGFEYENVNNLEDLKLSLEEFYLQSEKPKILEINTSIIENAQIQRDYFNFLKL
ncbi:2-succinyl-5-enolpyruvyl-6-hydroxy-3-cyclohexene-1-carboxylic-acid synthase [Moheibacter sediminis]|uniref:2-succinyl-5-enolpyruvyl-6-hydroxy-3-cyclohexene-1-carboxylate synthase n=1 Tax=Moheibacter sediminis TaxID=1434700 RepID=A0A1W2AKQ0_9FLAO|nr:2-succinyl-5-enolpyruvyl-6-hydroxy-3-cyclohexene-1-carboxylic-acid synthase [Moheibacter sediminis]SMC61275.1 2-succinyl-5-enolpyruvyl-6-hydroxy-3-cyclohexene-1-carboxylate synthase [Moheibacter sediminis]